ncbi:MAG: endonuclease/exonuclease/phosphatase family protein [Ktedonobacteraceae bacterium]
MNFKQESELSIFCWNIANPSIQRAGQQAEWLRKRKENLLVLTEAKQSRGCVFLERYFQAYGYNIIFPKPEGNEYGVMIISKLPLRTSSFSNSVSYIRSRVTSVTVQLQDEKLEIIGAYVPSRDTGYEKTQKKKLFLQVLAEALASNTPSEKRIFCGDLNILEPNHIPHYPFFEDWEYDFYRALAKYQLNDAFRCLNPNDQEYSWVGRTEDGYRYDHCFVSTDILSSVRSCYYLHQPRIDKLSDHSAIIIELAISNTEHS